MTSTEKENLVQQYKVHRVMTGRTKLYPQLYVLTNDEHWTMTPEAHKYAAATWSFCFVTTENGECLDEVIDDTSSAQVEFPKGVGSHTRDILERCMATCGKAAGARAKRRSRARKEALAQEVRGYHKQFAEAKHLEWKVWIDNDVFDLVDMRMFKPKNYVTGRWVLTIKTDKQGQMGTARFPRKPILLRPQGQDFG